MNREACKEFCAAPGGGYDCKAGPFDYCSQGEAVHGCQRHEAPPRESAREPYICPVCQQTGTSGYCDNPACEYDGCRFVGRSRYYTRASRFVENGLREEAPELPRSWQPPEIARDLRALQQQKAHETGAFVGSIGLSRDLNPHPEGTALWISWNAGWKDAAR